MAWQAVLIMRDVPIITRAELLARAATEARRYRHGQQSWVWAYPLQQEYRLRDDGWHIGGLVLDEGTWVLFGNRRNLLGFMGGPLFSQLYQEARRQPAFPVAGPR